jgi:hypothetical protein
VHGGALEHAVGLLAIPAILVTAWNLDGAAATEAITWLIGLLVDAIRHDRRPGADPGPR